MRLCRIRFTLEEALRVFLIQYRITPHCVTEVTSAEQIFNRPIRSHFTVNWSAKTKSVTSVNTSKKAREFAVRETVRCRNYRGPSKWKRKIIHRTGKLHYRVRLDDGRIWKRHVDQLLRSGEYEDRAGEPSVEWGDAPGAELDADSTMCRRYVTRR